MNLTCLRILSEETGLESEDSYEAIQTMLRFSTVDETKVLIQASAILARNITGVKMERDIDKKIIKLRKTIRDLRSMRARANEIPQDGVPDHVWRAITGSWWKIMLTYGIQVASKRRIDSVKDMSKDDALFMFDVTIKAMESDLAKLEKIQKRRKKP